MGTIGNLACVKLFIILIALWSNKLQLKLNLKSTTTFFKTDVFKVMEEPEEYVVEEKMHIISERVEAEPAEGTPTLVLIWAPRVFGLSHSLCPLVVSLSLVLQVLIAITSK